MWTRRLLLVVVPLAVLWTGLTQASGGQEVVRETLGNGLRVVIVPNRLAPVVTTQVNYLAGSNEAPLGFPGTAHAQEHMMFRGSPGLSAAQLSSLIAAMGGEFNADTQQTVTQYFFTVPAADLDIALRIEATRMRGVLDAPDLWEKERGAIDQEVAQDLSDPQYIFYSRLLAEAFAGTPYAHDALGTRDSFQKTTAAMLKGFHDAWYSPSNAILVVVGDVEPKRTLAQVRTIFGPIPARPVPSRPRIELQPPKPTAVELDTDLPYGLAVTAYRLPGCDSPDFAAAQILADVLDSARGALYALVPAGKALSTGFSASLLPSAGLGYATAAFPQGTDGASLVLLLKAVIADCVKNGFPPELVEAAKRREIASAEFRKTSVPGLAAAWSQALAVEGRGSPDDAIEAISRVTAADVDRVAREYLVNDTAIVAILTSRPSGMPVAGTRRGGGESFAPRQARPVTLPRWARRVLAPPQVPPSTRKPVVSTLANGLRVIVQPESVSRTISVFGRIRSNPKLEEDEGQEGVSEVLDDLFSYGTATLDRLAFQRELDAIGADLSAGTSFELGVLTEHFDRGVCLLADNLLRPALPEDAFEVVREQNQGTLAGRLQSPGYLSKRALHRALFPEADPTLREATPQTVGALKLSDVRAYHDKVFRPDLTTIVVIGQVKPAEALAVVERYFGAWRAAGPEPPTVLPPVPPNRPSSAVVPDASRVQSEVVLAQTLGITRSHPDYYPLQVGTHVLSGAFYATRLYVHLREETGLVYTVEASLNAGKTRSVYEIFFACDPPNVLKATAMVERDLRAMQTRPVSGDELRQAKALLVHQIPLAEASVEGIAQGFLERAVLGLPLDEPVRAAGRYLKLTAAQVRAAFNRWIRPQGFARVTTGPAPR